ncbi:uncharacterized protein BT62DRAFT_929155 [Guyanagaster necrorhizus]|uniref:PUB domain-containing protein n=1 Tax=Guyanagaster necrorhizus TaxID=856835 RepID=A0A9P7VXT4_9AGAR|nr:uncharacterized protein BT62DRAFT_929155 [Guyanagaster necrorhizus MCA 3950]KAG7449173.1 hypothetical protein BT62DRAFT_929155 [Guyanagaster necrorhizus MCA 3950]
MSDSSTSVSSSVSSNALREAAERRAQQQSSQRSTAQLAAEHERRQTFRRLVDPGIIRPNSKEQAMASIETLLTISKNLLREPENPKFQQFKPTNGIIKRNLMDPKGALEYAIELGFRPEVKNFQPFYTFNPRHMDSLRIGSAILKEAFDLETEKQQRAARAKKEEKAVAAAAANKVKLAFMDDRKTKLDADQREKALREARLAAAAAARGSEPSKSPEPSPSKQIMPGSGHVLGFDMLPEDDRAEHSEED